VDRHEKGGRTDAHVMCLQKRKGGMTSLLSRIRDSSPTRKGVEIGSREKGKSSWGGGEGDPLNRGKNHLL